MCSKFVGFLDISVASFAFRIDWNIRMLRHDWTFIIEFCSNVPALFDVTSILNNSHLISLLLISFPFWNWNLLRYKLKKSKVYKIIFFWGSGGVRVALAIGNQSWESFSSVWVGWLVVPMISHLLARSPACPHDFHNLLPGLKIVCTLISLDSGSLSLSRLCLCRSFTLAPHHCDGYKSHELMNLPIYRWHSERMEKRMKINKKECSLISSPAYNNKTKPRKKKAFSRRGSPRRCWNWNQRIYRTCSSQLLTMSPCIDVQRRS